MTNIPEPWASADPEICLIQEIEDDVFDLTVVCGPGGYLDLENATLCEIIMRAAHHVSRGARIEWDRTIRVEREA